MELSEYIMPGIGGKALSEEHALETARLLNMVEPDFIRVRTFAMHPKSSMQKMVEDGTFVSMTDEEMQDPDLLKHDRIERIAKGAGIKPEEVKELLNYYKKMKKMMKTMGNERKMRKMMERLGMGAGM